MSGPQSEMLGELAFTHYYIVLSERTGIPFTRNWKTLPDWEREAWMEAMDEIAEVIKFILPSLDASNSELSAQVFPGAPEPAADSSV